MRRMLIFGSRQRFINHLSPFQYKIMKINNHHSNRILRLHFHFHSIPNCIRRILSPIPSPSNKSLPSNPSLPLDLSSGNGQGDTIISTDTSFGDLPDHLLIEIFVRVPVKEWAELSCVRKQWSSIFRRECLWQAALVRAFPFAAQAKRWPGPIPRGLSRRRYAALYVNKHIFGMDCEMDEIVGHTYLFLKEQLEISTMPPPSGILHGTIIDQFMACGKSRDMAHELASQIWLAVLDNLEENEQTFLLLKRLALEGDIFLPYPYSRSIEVQWRVFEKLLTDFRDCFSDVDYFDVLSCAKNKFQPIPSTWLGY